MSTAKSAVYMVRDLTFPDSPLIPVRAFTQRGAVLHVALPQYVAHRATQDDLIAIIGKTPILDATDDGQKEAP